MEIYFILKLLLLNPNININRYVKEHHLASILAEGVCTNGHLNVMGLMKKYQFQEVLRIKNYWGSRHPEYICNACGKKPCECTGVIFVKKFL